MTATLVTNLEGRLRNTTLNYKDGLSPLYEAVVNSIYSLDKADDLTEEPYIVIVIHRSAQQEMEFEDEYAAVGRPPEKPIVGFEITDNGPGFREDNFRSFMTLDSTYKAEDGGRGVGRLLWLKAFKRVNVHSTYRNNEGELCSRDFVFSSKGVTDVAVDRDGSTPQFRQTSVHLEDFQPMYREQVVKTASKIAEALLEHCMWYFIRKGGAPKIEIVDADIRLCLDQLFEEYMVSSAVSDHVTVKSEAFDLIHLKMRNNSTGTHSIAYCADRRVVEQEKIAGKIPGLYGRLKEGNDEFLYTCYVVSDFLSQRARPERTQLDISENLEGTLFQHEVSRGDVRDAVLNEAKLLLSPYLQDNLHQIRMRIEDYVAKRAPRYRPILKYLEDSDLSIEPKASDKEVELLLHRKQVEFEQKLLEDGHDVLKPREHEDAKEYRQRIDGYLEKASDLNMANLAAYVAQRRVILDLFEAAISRQADGKFSTEDMIHTMIMPMRIDSNDPEATRSNLWIIDERLAFHDYLASDLPLVAIPATGSTERKEPDLISFNIFEQPILVSDTKRAPFASLTIVEFKRPMRNDAREGEDKDPVEQALGYLSRVREGGVETRYGRPITQSKNLPGYCYVICDLTESVIKRCASIHDMTRTSDGLGFFGYKKNENAYIEVISFEGLLSLAKMRNRAFFDKLGLPTM